MDKYLHVAIISILSLITISFSSVAIAEPINIDDPVLDTSQTPDNSFIFTIEDGSANRSIGAGTCTGTFAGPRV